MSFDILTPPNWQRSSVSKYCHVQLGKMLQSEPSGVDDELLPYLRAISISKSGVDLSHQFTMWIKPHEKDKFRLKRDDVLVSEGGDAGRTAHLDVDGEYYFQNAINRVRPIDTEQIFSRYLYYWFTFLKIAGYVEHICNVATIAHFTAEKVKAAPFAFPSLDTQKRIAAFLDEKTAQIDALIEKKQALLERLAEKRQAIITQAVTKGLNPAAPMKPSGIDWLGEIPAHWESTHLGYRYEVQLGRMLNAERSTGANLRPYLRVLDVQWDKINVDDLPEMDFPPDARDRYLLKAGDLLVNEGGSYVGRSAIWRGELHECYYQKALHRLRPRHSEQDTVEYLLFVFEAATKNAVFASTGGQTTIDHLTAEQLRRYVFPFPPFAEQLTIAAVIRSMSGQLQVAADQVQRSVDQLSEYRSALITAGVTGQIEGLQ
jgi:type I restriction enzyme, S subunit